MSAPSLDPVQTVIQGHTRVASWLGNLWASLGTLTEQPDGGPGSLEACFREQVREHVLFLEDRLLPSLLDLDPEPAVATLVGELRRDHLAILADCSRLFIDLASCMVTDDTAACVLGAHTRARALRERMLTATARERDQLIPLVRHHRDALAVSLAA